MKFEEQDNIKILFNQKLKYCFFSTPSFGYAKVHLGFDSWIVKYVYWQFKSLLKPCDVFIRRYDPGKYKNKFVYLFCFIWIYFQAYQVTSLFSGSQVHRIHVNKKTDSTYEFALSIPQVQVHLQVVWNLLRIVMVQFLITFLVQLCFKMEGSDKSGTDLDRQSWLIVMSECGVFTRIGRKLKLRIEPVWHSDKHDVIIDIPSNINDYSYVLLSICL